MTANRLDISGFLAWEDGLPRVRWDLVEAWIESANEPSSRPAAWIAVGREWLAAAGTALGMDWELLESNGFLALASRDDDTGRRLMPFAERCRMALVSSLGGVTAFDSHRKQILLVLPSPHHYYRYISLYFPEGRHGGSAGVHVREGYPHVVLHGKHSWALENSLAHELTHASLHHLSMPLWLEEGLAQLFEHNRTGRQLLVVDAETVRRHKRHWRKHGLDEFWRGLGFARAGRSQELSYQLSELLVRLLIEEGRPRWFGWKREPQRRLFSFLREASVDDCGEAACRKHLGYGLSDLAAKFLGPGPWCPGL